MSAVSGLNNVGVGSVLTGALTFTNGNETSGTHELIVSNTNEPGFGKFSIATAFYPGQNGATRRDNQFAWGYNNPSVSSYVAGDDIFMWNFENSYTTGEGLRQGELYLYAANGAGTWGRRVFSVTPAYDVGSCRIGFCSSLTTWGPTETEPWVQISCSGGDGNPISGGFTFLPNASTIIDFGQNRMGENGTVKDFITRGGLNLFGMSTANVGRLMAGCQVTSIGSDWGDAGTNDITLVLGSPGIHGQGFRWNHTDDALEFSTGSTWHKFLKNEGNSTVAGLPSASTSGAGARAYVTDANATTFGSVVAAGGSNKVPVYSNGTNWLIG